MATSLVGGAVLPLQPAYTWPVPIVAVFKASAASSSRLADSSRQA
uniref:Uncharacterized protein n=1 Tax=Anguilla anguilla TaxID=7936 RepID=A0A0E9QPS1_ANGAN